VRSPEFRCATDAVLKTKTKLKNDMLYDTSKRVFRAKVPVQVPRGFNPTEPVKLSSLAPPIDGEAIYSGMVLVKSTGLVGGINTAGAFEKATAAEAANVNKSFYIALHDQDSHDVQASGGLVGLDCSDDYEIQTGYFDEDIVWAVDMPLTVGDDGIVTEAATAGDTIIGYVTKVGSGTNNAIEYVGKTPSASSSLVIQFKTAKNGQVVAAEVEPD
jgi:hypothetical protein